MTSRLPVAACRSPPALRRATARRRFARLVGAALGSMGLIVAVRAEPSRTASHEVGQEVARRAAASAYLQHIYTVYFGLRACSEMSARENDGSFRPDVSIEEARRTLRSIDAATAEVSIDSNVAWTAAAPLATVTAEALKREPTKNLAHCQSMGALFRTDAANLQATLRALGAKTPLIPKDY